MKKKLVLLLISCITLETLLSGCSIPFLSHGDSSVDATEEALDLQDTSAYPIEEIMSYIHINEEQYVVGGDEIPEEYFTLVDPATNSKGLKAFYQDKTYELYLNGTVRDKDGNDYFQYSKDVETQLDAIRAWARVLKQSSFVGEEVIIGSMTVDAYSENEKLLTVDEVTSLFEEIEINMDNVNDYFTWVTESGVELIHDSNFEDEKIYAPYTSTYLVYTGPGEISNHTDPEFDSWKTDFKFVSKTKNTYHIETSLDEYKAGNLDNDLKKYSLALVGWGSVDEEVSFEPFGRIYAFDSRHTPETDKIYVTYFPNRGVEGAKKEDLLESLSEYEDLRIERVQGNIVIFKGVPEDYWSVSPNGYEYLAVQMPDQSIKRISKWGELYYDSTTTLDQEIEKKKNYFESHEYNFDRYYDWWDFREMFDLPEDYYNQYWSR